MRITTFVLACLIQYTLAAQPAPVKVHVVNSVTGTPISGASVVLEPEQGDNLSGRTDAGGVFAGQTHSAGSHVVVVTHKGYRMTGDLMGKMIDVKAEVGAETTVPMMPLGVIAGRVLDQYGDPVHHAIIRTEDKVSIPDQDDDYEGDSSATTDDRGEYRIAEVEPGKHFIAVEYSAGGNEPRSRYRWPAIGGLVLYPDATDIAQAQEVEVGAGSTIRLKDVRLTIQRAVTISGKIKPPPGENTQSLNLDRTPPLALHSSPMIQGGQAEADGSFKIGVLFPGTYVLTASDMKSGKVSKPVTLDVRDKDITDVEVELTSSFEINGRFVEGPDRIDFSKLVLNFLGGPVKIDGEGAFHANLGAAKAAYVLQGLPEDWYVKDVQVASRRIAGRMFEIEPGTTDLVFTLSPRGARVEISPEGTIGPMGTVYAVLLPESGPVPDVESALKCAAGPSGKFIMRGVPPGSYRVFMLGVTNWVLLMRPDMLLDKYRNLAPLVSIAEGERKSIAVQVLKVPAE